MRRKHRKKQAKIKKSEQGEEWRRNSQVRSNEDGKGKKKKMELRNKTLKNKDNNFINLKTERERKNIWCY